MELRQVQYFLGVTRAGSFGKAADELHVAKSALSRQIKLLEEELGAELLLRGGGRQEVELTAAGEAFMEHAVTIVEAVSQGRDTVRDLGAAVGSVRVIVAQGWDAWPGWSEMVAEFRRRQPGLTVNVSQADSIEALLGAVASGAADIAVLADIEAPSEHGLAVDVLHTEPVCAVLPAEHRLAGASGVRLADLEAERWVLAPIERALVARLAATAGFTPIVGDDAPTPAMVRSLVNSGAGISVCGVSEAEFYAPASVLVLQDPQFMASIFCVTRTASRGAATRVTKEFLRSCFGIAEETQSA